MAARSASYVISRAYTSSATPAGAPHSTRPPRILDFSSKELVSISVADARRGQRYPPPFRPELHRFGAPNTPAVVRDQADGLVTNYGWSTSSASVCADPTCSMILLRRPSFSAICTAVAPDAVLTLRMNATTGDPTDLLVTHADHQQRCDQHRSHVDQPKSPSVVQLGSQIGSHRRRSNTTTPAHDRAPTHTVDRGSYFDFGSAVGMQHQRDSRHNPTTVADGTLPTMAAGIPHR